MLALTHSSLAHEPGKESDDNQRLEYLGDAILGAVLAAELFARFPESGEGLMTKARAQLANKKSLSALGKDLQLGQFLILSKAEESCGGRDKASALADAFEAIIGAVYLDSGFAAAQKFVVESFEKTLDGFNVLPSQTNPKGELQEYLQSNSHIAPEYRMESFSGPDHDRVFECSVSHEGKVLASGQGKSKKEAESAAALAALLQLRANEKL
ncbi:MAG: rnc [Verrucomicrobiales bacterium]|nr:rnc [Verrucomicrobiales bacterium]